MARKKTIKDIKLDIENLKKMLEQAEENEAKERDNLILKVFSPIFTNEEICSFCDSNQKDKKIMDYIKGEMEKAMLSLIEAIKIGKVEFEDSISEMVEDKEDTEKISKETEIEETEE